MTGTRYPRPRWHAPIGRVFRTIALLSVGLLLASVAQAVTLYVETGGWDTADCSDALNPCATVSYAVTQAGSDDTIVIAAGVYTETAGLVLDKSLNLQGAGRDETILQAHEQPGAAGGRVISIVGELMVQISDLTIRHGVATTGYAPDNVGGGIFILEGVTLNLDRVTISDNVAVFGGGMISIMSTHTLTDVVFRDNSAMTDGEGFDGNGGGLYVLGGSSGLNEVLFEGNTAILMGGGMMGNGSAQILAEVTFRDNSADYQGGGIYVISSTLDLTDITFVDNWAAAAGGGLFGEESMVALSSTNFIDNNALQGGGMFNRQSGAELNDVLFSGNIALLGGGVMNFDSSPIFLGVTFRENFASRFGSGGGGGGMFNAGGSAPQLTDVVFDGNTTLNRGGGMYNEAGCDAELSDVLFSGNEAYIGGGLFNAGSAPVLSEVDFTGNTASISGGAMHNQGGSAPSLMNVTITGNQAPNGGGMSNNNSAPVIVATTFSGNSADSGGGMFNTNGATPWLSDVHFIGNTTMEQGNHHGGAGMYNAGSAPVLFDVQFIDNESASSGGGMHNYNSSMPRLTNVLFRGNITTQGSGGGLYSGTGSVPELTNVTFVENTAHYSGGGMSLVGSDAELVNVLFHGNRAGQGGGLYLGDGTVVLTNATLAGNVAEAALNRIGGGVHIAQNGSITLLNTIVWGNMAESRGHQISIDTNGSAALSYSLYGNGTGDIRAEGLFQAQHSLTADPLFLAADDLRLQMGSPAEDAGDPDTDLGIFATDTHGDPVDLAGNPRLFGQAVDLGVYEVGEPGDPQPRTRVVSRASGADGVKGNNLSLFPMASAGGRFVAFTSHADNLHPDDTDNLQDIFLRDEQTYATMLVSRASGPSGPKGNGDSAMASVSAGGRFVAFASTAVNLHPDDFDAVWDVYVRDTHTQETILVSRAGGTDGAKGNGDSTSPSISADGRYVAFTSHADNLHPDAGDMLHSIYVRDLHTEQTILVSRAGGADGVNANGPAQGALITPDGRRVVFTSRASNLHPDDTDIIDDVFVRDLDTNEIALVSRASGADGAKGNGPSGGADEFKSVAISADGRYVAFLSVASNLHPDASDAQPDVYVRDLLTQQTLLANRADGADGAKANGPSTGGVGISADGRYVVFDSMATNLHPDDTDPDLDVYVRDMDTHRTVLISRADGEDGVKGNGFSGLPWIAAGGGQVAFVSDSTNLDPGDTDGIPDVYLRDWLGFVPVQVALVFDVPELDFGEVDAGSTSPPLTVLLRNIGDADADELEMALAGEEFTVDDDDCGDGLSAGATCELILWFTPEGAGPVSGQLTVSAGTSVATLTLHGTGIAAPAPEIDVQPGSLAVTLVKGASDDRSLVIANAGDAPLNWSIAMVAVASDARVAAGMPDACTDPGQVVWLDVQPATGTTPTGGESTVEVLFDTGTLMPGEYQALLCIASDDPVTPSLVVPVALTVIEPQSDLIFSDRFQQE